MAPQIGLSFYSSLGAGARPSGRAFLRCRAWVTGARNCGLQPHFFLPPWQVVPPVELTVTVAIAVAGSVPSVQVSA